MESGSLISNYHWLCSSVPMPKMEHPITPKLLPFAMAVSTYFSMGLPAAKENQTLIKVFLKCLPIYCLIGFVLVHWKKHEKSRNFLLKIALGLILSSIGDACLVFPAYFLYGMAAFALAHLAYISSFGWEPLFQKSGVALYVLAFSGVALIFPSLKNVFAIAVPVYSALLATMAWRGVARYQYSPNQWRLAAAIGAILFLISDGVISIDMFYTPIPHAEIIVMGTYYAAQLGIALSVVDTPPKIE